MTRDSAAPGPERARRRQASQARQPSAGLKGERAAQASAATVDPAVTGGAGGATLLTALQRTCGNQAVQRLLAQRMAEATSGSGAGLASPTVQRVTVTKFNKAAEVGDQDDFRAMVETALKEKKQPGELRQVVQKIVEAAADAKEDLDKLRAGLKLIKDGLNKHQSGLKAQKVTELRNEVVKAEGAIRRAEQKRFEEQKEIAKKDKEAQEIKADAARYWLRLQDLAVDHGLEVAWLVQNAGFEVAQPHRWFVSGWDQPDGFGMSCEIVDKKAVLPPASPPLVIHYHCAKDGAIKAQSVKRKIAEKAAGGNIFATSNAFQFPLPPTLYSKAEISARMPKD